MEEEKIQLHSSTEPEAIEIAKLAVHYNLAGYKVVESIKQAFHVLNESRRYANELQQKRMQKLNEKDN